MKTRYLLVLAGLLLAASAWGLEGGPLVRRGAEPAPGMRGGAEMLVTAQAGQSSAQTPSPAETPAEDPAAGGDATGIGTSGEPAGPGVAAEEAGPQQLPAEAPEGEQVVPGAPVRFRTAPAEEPGRVAEEPVGGEGGTQMPVPVPVPPGSPPPPPFPPPPPVPGAPPTPRYAPRFSVPGASPVPAPSAPPVTATGGGFLIKFNNADLYEVIHTLGRMAGINYLIDPRVRGVVNIHTQGTIRKEGALDLLFSILKINGATAVREGEVYHIVPMAEAKMEPLLLAARAVKEGQDSPNRPAMRAFALQYIAAAEMAKVLQPFLTAGGDVTEVSRANVVLVTDTAANMEKHERLVELFDADAFQSAGVKLFPLKFLDPEEMAKDLETIFGALDFGVKGGKLAGIHFVPLTRMNALLSVSASPRTMEAVERWIGELDREPTGTARTVHLYRVRHGKVRDVMDILEKLYPGKSAAAAGKPTEFKPRVAEPADKPAPAAKAEPPSASTLQGANFDIILDEPMNALIIRGSASEYAAILEVLQTIDVYPRQVLLEVLIAEVQLDDALRLGIDWNYVRQSGSVSHDVSLVTSAAGISSGLKYVVEKTDRLTGALRALANDGKVSVLSSPSVISVNGKKSKIDVSDSVPIVSGRVTNPGTEQFVTETVEYRDVGILLSFTPYINDEGIVTLEIDQEVSEVKTASAGASTNPSFFKRSVSTTLIATQDRSIVLGGLVKERRERTRDGIPFLYKIPVIGWIFGARSDTVNRTELLIFITPRVIGSVTEGTRLSREFEERVEELRKRIGESKGVQPAPEPEPAR